MGGAESEGCRPGWESEEQEDTRCQLTVRVSAGG